MSSARDMANANELHSTVLARLDSTGGVLTALHNALYAADEAGFHVQSDRDRAVDIDNYLGRAMEVADDTDPDPKLVCDRVESARRQASYFRTGLDGDVAAFELPEYVDSGVYDTLGEYARYVEQDIRVLMQYAEAWADAAE